MVRKTSGGSGQHRRRSVSRPSCDLQAGAAATGDGNDRPVGAAGTASSSGSILISSSRSTKSVANHLEFASSVLSTRPTPTITSLTRTASDVKYYQHNAVISSIGRTYATHTTTAAASARPTFSTACVVASGPDGLSICATIEEGASGSVATAVLVTSHKAQPPPQPLATTVPSRPLPPAPSALSTASPRMLFSSKTLIPPLPIASFGPPDPARASAPSMATSSIPIGFTLESSASSSDLSIKSYTTSSPLPLPLPATSSAAFSKPPDSSTSSTLTLVKSSVSLPTAQDVTSSSQPTRSIASISSKVSPLTTSISTSTSTSDSPTIRYTLKSSSSSTLTTLRTAQPASHQSPGQEQGTSLAHPSSGTILGVALGGTISLVLLLLLIVFLLRRRRRYKHHIDDAPKLPPMSTHFPLILPLPASADPQNDGWVGSNPRMTVTPGAKPPSHQTAITAAGIRLVPREEPPPLTSYSHQLQSVPETSRLDPHTIPLIPARSPLRSSPSSSAPNTSQPSITIPPAVATRSSPSVRSYLRPSRLLHATRARSRASSYTTFDTRSESVYSTDSNGRRRRSDPFSWQKS